MAKVLYRLGMLYDDKQYIEKSKRMLMNVRENILQYPSYYANWAILMDWFIDEPYEVAIVGNKAMELNTDFGKHFLPNCIFTGTSSNSKLPLLADKGKQAETLIYVCQNKTCQLRVKTVAEGLSQMRK